MILLNFCFIAADIEMVFHVNHSSTNVKQIMSPAQIYFSPWGNVNLGCSQNLFYFIWMTFLYKLSRAKPVVTELKFPPLCLCLSFLPFAFAFLFLPFFSLQGLPTFRVQYVCSMSRDPQGVIFNRITPNFYTSRVS